MVLDVHTQTFHDARNDILDLKSKGALNKETFNNYMKLKGIDPQDFVNANETFVGIKKKTPDYDFTPGHVPGRVTGRAIGETASGLEWLYDNTLGHIIPDEWVESGDKWINKQIGKEGQKTLQGLVDPYHGEGVGAVAEEMGGHILSYIMPFKAATKIGKAAAFGPTAFLNPVLQTKVRKALSTKPTKLLGYGTAGVATEAMFSDPRTEAVYKIMEEEDGNKIMERLSEDPDDLLAQADLDLLLESLGFEAGIAGVTLGLIPIWRKLKKSGALKQIRTPISQFVGRWGTSTRGTDRDMIGLEMARNTAGERAINRAYGVSNDIKKMFKSAFGKTNTPQNQERIEAINKFLGKKFSLDARQKQELMAYRDKLLKEGYVTKDGEKISFEPEIKRKLEERYTIKETDPDHPQGTDRIFGDLKEDFSGEEIVEGLTNQKTLDKLMLKEKARLKEQAALRELEYLGFKPDLIDKVKSMRKDMDDLSEGLGDKVVSSDLAATFDANLGSYVTRTYLNFIDPKYNRKIKKSLENYIRGNKNKDSEVENIIQEAARSIKTNNPNMSREEIGQELFEIVNQSYNRGGRSGVADALMRYSGHSQTGTTRAKLFHRRLNDPSIRKLLGEVDDPFENYMNTMVHLSKMDAQANFTKDVTDLLIKKGLYTSGQQSAVRHGTSGLPKGEAGKHGMIFGKGMMNTFDDVNKIIFGETKTLKEGQGIKGRNFDKLNKHIKEAVANDYKRRGLDEKAKKVLDGAEVYIPDNYGKFIEDSFKPANTNNFLSMWAGTKSWTQQAKTVFHPTTHSVNIMGNMSILAANGIVPIGEALPAAMNSAKRLAGVSNERFAEKWNDYTRLGLVGSRVDLGLIQDNLRTFSKKSEQAFTEELSKRKGLRNIFKKTRDLYQMEDDIFKIMHYEHTLKKMKKAYPNESFERVKELAAQRTRDLMPNYNLVPKMWKSLRYAPVGDFAAFPAEMTRISKNLVKYTIDDFLSDNKELRKGAARRLAGITTVGLTPYILQKMSAADHGITSEQENAVIEKHIPSYYQDTGRVYTSGINLDSKDDLTVEFIPMGALDPFEYLKTTAKGLYRAILSDDISSDEQDKIVFQTMEKLANPFVGSSMLTDAIVNAMTGRDKKYPVGSLAEGTQHWVDTALGIDSLGIAGAELTEVMKPGFLNFLERKVQYARAMAAQDKRQRGLSPLVYLEGLDPFGIIPKAPAEGGGDMDITGHELTERGIITTPDATELGGLFGIRPVKMDLTTGYGYQVFSAANKQKTGRDKFTEEATKDNLIRNDIPTVVESYKDSITDAIDAHNTVDDVLQSLRIAGFDEKTIDVILQRALTKRGDEEDITTLENNLITGARNNTLIPSSISDTVWNSRTLREGDLRGYDMGWLRHLLEKLSSYNTSISGRPFKE